ncbi:hypothetical protein [Shewanella sp. SW24]|uniref:hypothetical protein n=1 Tax=Shewanella sp. SW24 TaxID=2912815 RepID=UPI0021DB3C3B|nr:hypothetical protein [Shewanella sp. SW24]MCU7985592.1 hypothetical protein [Shewanella sp. SW24]
MKRYLKVGDSCKVCSTPRVDISHQTLLEILELRPSIKSIQESVLAKGKDFYAICPSCDAYALGMELTTGFPFTEADGNITNIQEITSRSDLGW